MRPRCCYTEAPLTHNQDRWRVKIMPKDTTTTEPTYKWAHPLEWLRYTVNEHREDPAWLADCITSLTTNMDGDTIQDLFQSEMVADGYFAAESTDGDSDNDCPVGDPECLSDAEGCHDACEVAR
jgi:hypothetical protein